MSGDGWDDLLARARDRAAQTAATPDEWGYRVQLEPGDTFVGRWCGETTDLGNDGRRVFLLWDSDGEACYSRFYAALGREVDQARPTVGDTVAIARGNDYVSAHGTGYSFGLVVEPNGAPLPGAAKEAGSGDDIPF